MNRLLPVMILAGLFLMVVQIYRQSGAVLAIHFQEVMSLSATQIGLVSGAMYLGATLVQVPTGILFDRFGARITLSAMGLLAIGGLLWFATADQVLGLAASRMLIGIGHGGVITGIYMLAIAWTSPERMASTSALVIGLAGGIGGVLATTPLAVMLDRFGFLTTFLLLAAVTATATVAIWVLVRDHPSVPHQPASLPVPRQSESLQQSLRGVWQIVCNRDLQKVIVMGSCFSAPFMTLGGLWAGPYMTEVFALQRADASYVLLAMMIAFNLGTVAYGPLDRWFNTRKYVVLGGVVVMAALLIILAFLADSDPAIAIVLLVSFAFFTPMYPVLMAHCRGFVPVQQAGRAITTVTLIGLGGVFGMQLGTGMVMDALRDGAGWSAADAYRMVFLILAIALLLAASVYARVRDIKPRPVAAAPVA
jgi:predicted MFS family arabinose efflux permease